MLSDSDAMLDVSEPGAPRVDAVSDAAMDASSNTAAPLTLSFSPSSAEREQAEANLHADNAKTKSEPPPSSNAAPTADTTQSEPSTTAASDSNPTAPLLPPVSAAATSASPSPQPSATAATPSPALASPSSATTAPSPAGSAAASPFSPPASPHAAQPAPAKDHSDSEDTTVESYAAVAAGAAQPTRITVQLPRKTHADVVFYHLPTHRDALHHLSILRHIINASEHTDDNTAITYAQYAANPHTKKFYQGNLPLPATLDPLPFTVRCLVRCLNRVSQQKKVVDVEHVLPSERSAHVYSTLRLQVIQLYGSHPPVYPFAPTMIAPSLPTTTLPAPMPIAIAPPAAPAAADTTATSSSGSSGSADAAASSSSSGSPAVAPGPQLPIPPEKQRPTDVVFFYLASYNDVMYHNSILSNVLHTIGQKDDKAYISYSLYLASPRTTEHYPTGPPLPRACDPIPFTLRGVLSCLARVRRQRRAQKTQLTGVEPLERNGVVYARIREQVFRLYDGQPPSMTGLDGPKRGSSSGGGKGGKGAKQEPGDDGDDRMDEDDEDDAKTSGGAGGLGATGLSRSLSASSDDSVPGSPGSPSSASEPDMLDHLLNASAAVNGSEVKLMRAKQRREAERRRKRLRDEAAAGGSDGKGKGKEARLKVEGADGKGEKEGGKGEKSEEEKKKAESEAKEAAEKKAKGDAEKAAEQERERVEKFYGKLSEQGSSALPDRDTFLKLWAESR